MSKRKYKVISIISIVLLALVVLLNITATLAFYKDRKDYNGSLELGKIKINANNEIGANSYFSSSSVENVKPGDYLLNKDVEFSLDSTSDPAYVRAKLNVSAKQNSLSKNLFDPRQWATPVTNGVTVYYSETEDCFVFNGTAISTIGLATKEVNIPLKQNTTYTASNYYVSGTIDKTNSSSAFGAVSYFGRRPNNGNENWIAPKMSTEAKSSETGSSSNADFVNKFWFYIAQGTSFTNYKIRIQLEEGSTSTDYEKYIPSASDNEVANYLKYRNLTLGKNLLDQDYYANIANYSNRTYNKLPLNLKSGVSYTISLTENLVNGTGFYVLITNDIDYSGSSFAAGCTGYWIGHNSTSSSCLKPDSPITFTTSTTNTDYYLAVYSGGNAYEKLPDIFKNLQLVETSQNLNYVWSEKIGDYYYLLNSTTGEPLEVKDSTKTYTFLTKENSKIASNLSYGSDLSGSPITVNIGLEALQVANLKDSDTTKTTLENIQTKLNAINNANVSNTHTVAFVVSGKSYYAENVAYAGEATIPTEVMTEVNKSGFTGFAFSAGGYPVITKGGNCHTRLNKANSKLENVTENLVLYPTTQTGNVTKYTITFKNYDNTVLQTGTVEGGNNAYYTGSNPKKASANGKSYVFSGWKSSVDNKVYTDLTLVTISQNTTFTAVFTEQAQTYSIDYVLNGGSFTQYADVVNSYTYGTSLTLPKAPSGSGEQLLDFSNYSASFPAGANYTEISTNSKMTAGKTYLLSFNYTLTNYGGGTIGCGIGCGPSGSYTKDILTLVPYTGSSGTFSVKFTPTADQLSGREYLSIRFVRSSSDTAYATINATNIRFEELQEVTKKGYTFAGWYETSDFSGSAVTSISSSSTGDKKFYAKWIFDGSTVTLNLAGGDYNGNTSNVKYTFARNSTVNIPSPTKDDYIFAGWGSNSTNINYLKNATYFTGFVINSANSSGWAGYADSGTVTRGVISDSTSETGYSLSIKTENGTDYRSAGFCATVNPEKNMRYIIKVRAKFPTDLYITHYKNRAGCDVYLGSRYGTNDWQDYYMLTTPCNELQGSSKTFGYWALEGSDTRKNCTWYVNDYKIYRISDSAFSNLEYTFDSTDTTLTAKWQQKATRIIFNAEGGTVKAQEWGGYSSGGSNANTHSLAYVGVTYVGNPEVTRSEISKSGYVFDGWWTGSGGTGSMLINAGGTLQVVSGYTETASGGGAKWTRTGDYSAVTLYAKWVTPLKLKVGVNTTLTDDYTVTSGSENKDTYFFANDFTCTAGQTYRVSFWATVSSDSSWTYGPMNLFAYKTNLKNGYNTVTFTATNTRAFFWDDFSQNASDPFTITNLYVELVST